MGVWGSRARGRLTYSNVIATLALFIALGGSSYAAVKLKRNSVKSKHIGTDQVKGVDVEEASLGPVPFAQRAAVADALATPLPPGQTPESTFKRTIIVSPGTTLSASGNNLEQAVEDIDDAGAASPVLVWVEPGTYEVDEEITLDPHVAIQGADRSLTFLTGSGSGEVNLVDNTALRDLNAAASLDVRSDGATSVGLERVDVHSLAVSTGNDIHLTDAYAPGATFIDTADLTARDSNLPGGSFTNSDGVTARESNLQGAAFTNTDQVTARDSDLSQSVFDAVEHLLVVDSYLNTALITDSASVFIEGGSATDMAFEDTESPVSVNDADLYGSTVIDNTTVSFANSLVNSLSLLGSGTAACARSYDGTYADLSASCN
jgi:hypothetical protein